MDYGVKSYNLAIKDVDTRQGIVTGYFAAFDNVDSDGDVIVKGAFAKSIAERGPGTSAPSIKHLLDHNTTKAVGVLQVLREDSHGLYYESKAGRHTLGRDFLAMCEDGLITEHSIGFRWVQGKSERRADGAVVRHEVHLKEGSSLQCWGANSSTPLLGVKAEAMTADERTKALAELTARHNKLTKALKGAYSDDLCELLEIQALQLESFCKSLLATPSLEGQEEPERTRIILTSKSSTPDVPAAKQWLNKAIARHERHMSGAEATSDASQQKMMNEMTSARQSLGGETADMSGMKSTPPVTEPTDAEKAATAFLSIFK